MNLLQSDKIEISELEEELKYDKLINEIENSSEELSEDNGTV